MHGARVLTDFEQEAWSRYESLVDLHNVRMYDRVSVLNAFPDIRAAFDQACAARTFYELTKDHNEN